MIRKPVMSDAEWIYDLIRSEFPTATPSVGDIQKWIANEQVVVDDSMKAFVKWTKHDGYINVDLGITHPDSRGLGLMTILFSYVSWIFQKPVSFFTSAENNKVKNATFLGEITDTNGVKWHRYTKRT